MGGKTAGRIGRHFIISGDLTVPVTTVNGKDFVVSFDKEKLDALL